MRNNMIRNKRTMISFTRFQRMDTKRLNLRPLEIGDDQEIFFFRSDQRINQYLVAPIAKSIEEAREFIHTINTNLAKNDSGYWGICLKGRDKLIGTICLWNLSVEENKAEIGYVLHPDLQGKGLMQEAMARVIEFGFEQVKLGSIEGVLHPGNAKSIALLERNGFMYIEKSGDEAVYRLISPVKNGD